MDQASLRLQSQRHTSATSLHTTRTSFNFASSLRAPRNVFSIAVDRSAFAKSLSLAESVPAEQTLFLQNLRAGNVGGLLNDTIRNAFLRNELCHLPNFLLSQWKWHTNGLLHCATLHPLLPNVLPNFDSLLHHFRDRYVNDHLQRCALGFSLAAPTE